MSIDPEFPTRLPRDPGSRPSAENVFRHVRGFFQELGILGRMLSLEYEGASYRISCDERSFMVYRVSSNTILRHHLPGWPVCMVNSDLIFEECESPGLGQDHYSCSMNVEKWLEMIDDFCRNSSRNTNP